MMFEVYKVNNIEKDKQDGKQDGKLTKKVFELKAKNYKEVQDQIIEKLKTIVACEHKADGTIPIIVKRTKPESAEIIDKISIYAGPKGMSSADLARNIQNIHVRVETWGTGGIEESTFNITEKPSIAKKNSKGFAKW